jgi:hypothetical protein
MCGSGFQPRHFVAVHKAINIEQLCHFLQEIWQMVREFAHKEYAFRNILLLNPSAQF